MVITYYKSKYSKILTEEYLRKEYIKKDQSTRVIGAQIGCSAQTICKYLKKYNIDAHKITKLGREMKSIKMSNSWKKGLISPRPIGKPVSDEAIRKAQKKLIGRRLNPKGEFKKEHKIRKKGYKIHKHHIDLNKRNCNHDNILYLNISIHQKLHRHAYNYLIEKGLLQDYTKYFLKKFKVKTYARKEYKNRRGDVR